MLMHVYVDENPQDADNVRQVLAGEIARAPDGRLVAGGMDPVRSAALSRALGQVLDRQSLPLEVERPVVVKGEKVIAFGEVQVKPGESEYLQAVARALERDFGYSCRFL